MPATVIEDLVAVLKIPSGDMLSRMMYRDDQLRVVGFAFDTGQELSEHNAPRSVIIQVISGRLALTLGDDKVEATVGTWVHMPPKMPPKAPVSTRAAIRS